MIVILVDGERNTLVTLKKAAVEKDLRRVFSKLAASDPIWKTWSGTHYPTFQTFRETFQIFTELAPSEKLTEGQRIKVIFSVLAPVDTSQQPTEQPDNPTTSHVRPNSIALSGNAELQKDWLASLGVVHDAQSTGNSVIAEVPRESEVNGSSIPKNKPEDANDQGTPHHNILSASEHGDDDDDDDDDSYMELINQRKEFNRKRLAAFNIVPPKGPKVRKKQPKKKKGKENEPLQAVELRRSSRISAITRDKEIESESGGPDDDFSVGMEDVSEQAVQPNLSASVVQPQGPSSLEKVTAAKSRKKQKKVTHRIGGKITKYTPLTLFSDEVTEIVRKGIGEQDQKDVETINKFMVGHIKKVTGGTELKKSEYKELRKQVGARLTEMKVDQANSFAVKIVYALSVHLRNAKRKEERRAKEKEKRAATLAAKANACEASSSKNIDPQSNVDLDDELLRKPVINESSVKYALRSSSTRFEVIKTMSLRDAMTTYPYLSNPKLVIDDYLIRVSKSFEEAEENFESTLLPLKMVLDMETQVENELDKLKIILEMDEHFSENEGNWPLLQFCDEANQIAAPLDHIPIGQSPALIILQNDREITSATLVFDGESLLTMKKPTSFQSVALLLAGYFIYDMEYPIAYLKQLRILEIILHGEKLGNENIAVMKFLEKVECSKQILQGKESTRS